MQQLVDLRSDTLTRPTRGMREAITNAEVGYDVFGEDPTVNRLQDRVAEMLGKEAALFLPSGTMANEVAIRCLTFPGDEVLIEANAHPVTAEAGAAAVLSGVQLRPIIGERGVIRAGQIEGAIRPPDIHYPIARLITLENTHNQGGGTIFPIDEIQRIRQVADRCGLRMHMDGARLMNACVATGIPPRRYAEPFDSVSLCLSKGLGAPVGSMLAGSEEFVQKALRARKMFGGGMRQAGILAAAGLYALDHHVDRLAEDHHHAKMLAQGLADMPGVSLEVSQVDTNILIVDISPSAWSLPEAMERLRTQGVLVLPFGPTHLRAVTHMEVDRKGIERAIEGFRRTFS